MALDRDKARRQKQKRETVAAVPKKAKPQLVDRGFIFSSGEMRRCLVNQPAGGVFQVFSEFSQFAQVWAGPARADNSSLQGTPG